MELLQNSEQTQQAEATAPQLDQQTTPLESTPNLQAMTAQQLVDQLALLLQQEEPTRSQDCGADTWAVHPKKGATERVRCHPPREPRGSGDTPR